MKRVLKIAKKAVSNEKNKVDHLWEIIRVPLFILIVYSILTSFLPSDIYNSKTFPLWIINSLVSLFSFGYVGYKSIKIMNNSKFAIKAGAYTGAILGLIGAILGLVLVYFFPERFESVFIEMSNSLHLEKSIIKYVFKIISWINLIIGPIFNGLIGALISWLSALIFKKR